MIQQYRVFYKRGKAPNWGVLEQGLHANLYDVPEVAQGVQVLRDNPVVEAVVVRREDALFNLVRFEQDAIAPKAFILNPAPAAKEGAAS